MKTFCWGGGARNWIEKHCCDCPPKFFCIWSCKPPSSFTCDTESFSSTSLSVIYTVHFGYQAFFSSFLPSLFIFSRNQISELRFRPQEVSSGGRLGVHHGVCLQQTRVQFPPGKCRCQRCPTWWGSHAIAASSKACTLCAFILGLKKKNTRRQQCAVSVKIVSLQCDRAGSRRGL